MSDSQSAPRILVLRLSSLGDIILTAPVYKNLRRKWPDARIAVMVKPQFAAALRGHPDISEIIPFRGLISAVLEARKGGYTHLLDLHNNPRTRIISAFSAIPLKARYRKDALARRLFVGIGLPSPALQRHTLERYLDSLAAFEVPVEFRYPELRDWTPDPAAKETAGVSRVCVIQTAFLGDAALTLPLLAKTRQSLKCAGITVVCRPDTAEIFRSCPQVDRIIVDDKRSGNFFSAFFKLVRELKSGVFDTAIIPHRSLRSALAAFWAGIPVRVGFHSSPGRMFLNRRVPFSWLLHDAERNLTLLGPFSDKPIAAPSAGVSAMKPASPRSRVDDRLGKYSGRELIGVHPGSVWQTKKWPPERYAALIRRLALERGTGIVLVGGKSDETSNRKVKRLSGENCLDWTGQTTLDELAALMTHLKLFVTNDSGPMHMAAAFNVPTLAIFGPTTRELGFFPYGEGHRVVEADVRCRPCGLHGGKKCPRGHFLCMNLITVDMVCKNATEMLGKTMLIPNADEKI